MDSPELFSLFFLKVRRSVFARVAAYIEARAERGYFRAYPDADAAARVVVETVAVFARGRHKDPDPQPADEAHFRAKAGLPALSPEVAAAWEEDGGVRRPVTLVQDKTEPVEPEEGEPDEN